MDLIELPAFARRGFRDAASERGRRLRRGINPRLDAGRRLADDLDACGPRHLREPIAQAGGREAAGTQVHRTRELRT